MSETFSDTEGPTESARLAALRRKIRVICHAIRLVTLAYALFVAFGIYAHWSDRAEVERKYAAFFKLDITGASATQYALAVGISVAVWAALAVLCWFVWQLFGRYLRGDIFSRASAALLQRIGVMGLFVVATDFAARSLIAYVLGLHLADRAGARHGFVRPDDVLYLVICLAFIALGFIYKAAAEIADEHAQII